jgi:uncharacterized cupin superfamily protein
MNEAKILKLDSTAPHLWPAARWRDFFPHAENFILHRSADSLLEAGIRRWSPGQTTHETSTDMLCYVLRGAALFRSRGGDIIDAAPGTLIHFKQGWSGSCEIRDELHASCMTCPGGPGARTPVLKNALTAAPLKDWGEIPTMIAGASRTAGILLSREENGRAESGLWTCTPGIWRCVVTADEFCHFLAGTCSYTHDSGEQIEIQPDTLAFFPQGWSGQCAVRQTIRKIYMIR